MRQLWSRMTWGLTLACALALCTGSAQAINTNPYEQYPVRTTIGIVALILAIALALFAILRSWIKAGIRPPELRGGYALRHPHALSQDG